MSDDLWFLGTGAAEATRERDNTALLISCGEKLVLIDCPGCVVRKLRLLDLEPERIAAVLVTHTHTDHVYGLPSLVHNLKNRDMRLPLFGSRETIDFCRRLLEIFHLTGDKVRCRVEFNPLEDGAAFEPTRGLSGRAMTVPHRSSSLAFFFLPDRSRRELLYSGDTPPHPPLFQRTARIDTLIHDCSVPSRLLAGQPHLGELHTDALSLGRLAEESVVRRLVPVHIADLQGFQLREIESEIRVHFTGELLMPRDLMRISI